jgi:hypothetical protein
VASIFPVAVYTLCFLTSAGCAWLLRRQYLRTGARLLMWSGLCFLFLAGNNLLLMTDLLVFPEVDLRLPRLLLSLTAVSLLLFGLIWDAQE